MARAWQRWHQLGGKVRPVLGDVCLVGKGRRPAAAVGWDSKPLPRRFGGRGPRLECLMTWGSCIPALTARAGEDRRFRCRADPARTSAARQLGKTVGCWSSGGGQTSLVDDHLAWGGGLVQASGPRGGGSSRPTRLPTGAS